MASPEKQYPPEVDSYNVVEQRSTPYVPSKAVNSDYPLIDCDPHFYRVLGYARSSDYVAGTAVAAAGPALMMFWERMSPSRVSGKGLASVMRLNVATSVAAGFLFFYQRSISRFYGFSENRREIDMDMREMVGKVKRGESLYGASQMTEYMQGAAARQSRYSGVFLPIMPWFNFANHPHHGVDTAKYYRQAEKELEAEKAGQ